MPPRDADDARDRRLPSPASLEDALAEFAFAVTGVLSRMAAAQDLTIAHARLLGIVRDRDPTISQLAALLRLDKSSVTGLVDRAHERGLVDRIPSTVDGRSVVVRITARGRTLVNRSARQFAEEIATMVSDLSPKQREDLASLAARVVACARDRVEN